MNIVKRKILIVEDDEVNQLILAENLSEIGMDYDLAENGQIALDRVNSFEYDVILLDLNMPVLGGKEVLRRLKSSNRHNHIPIIVISAENDFKNIIECIEMGALDYLPKPFDPILLRARLKSSLASRDLHEQQQIYMQMVKDEQRKLELLLFNMLPFTAAFRLKNGDNSISDYYEDASVLFLDIVGFTKYASSVNAEKVVNKLNSLFSEIDDLSRDYELEKIKTIGDSYMVAGGIPNPTPEHLFNIAKMSLHILKLVSERRLRDWPELEVRMGIHTGPLIGGVIGKNKFTYDIWGDTVNLASRMESHGLEGKIQVSEKVKIRLGDKFEFESRGKIHIKGKGEMDVYFLVGEK